MATFREQIKDYVDDLWAVPCSDGIVWVFYEGIDTRASIARHKQATGKEWVAAFLKYPDPTFGSLEGLYLIAPTDLGKVAAGQFDARLFNDRKMIASWFDKADRNNLNAEVMAQKPDHHGLNDCAHFVSQALAAGGIRVETQAVPTLWNSLQALPDAKTLARAVTADAAENVVKSGVMRPGDVLIYSLGAEHHHSVVYVGGAQVAMHTWANHPTHPTLKGDWKASATADHPLVSLIHFGRDDAAILPNSSVPGWWRVTWRGGTFFYHFDRSGRVGWTRQSPARADKPMVAPEGKGHWFQEPLRVSICWTSTGSHEVLAGRGPRADTHMEGTWNGSDRLVADKMA